MSAAQTLRLTLSEDTFTLPGRIGVYRQLLEGGATMGANVVGFVCVGHPANFELQERGPAYARRIVQCVNAHAGLVEARRGMVEAHAVPSSGCKERPAYEAAVAALRAATGEPS